MTIPIQHTKVYRFLNNEDDTSYMKKEPDHERTPYNVQGFMKLVRKNRKASK